MPKIRTIYNPGVAMVYTIQNLKTGETHVAATCGIKDVEFKPWRSPKGTPAGKEFFKMKLGNKKDGFEIITFLNSSLHSRCLSEDGDWEFTGQRPDGGVLYKLADQPAKGETEHYIPSNSKRVKISVQNVDNNDLSASPTEIHTTIENEEFVDMEEMNKILN